jgi:hypothetical protein
MGTPSFRLCSLIYLFNALATGCGDFADDTDRYAELDKLRILGLRSEPADLVLGETATLSALVYEPKARDVRYEWSWCPSRSAEDGNFECNISERELSAAWTELGLEGEPPSYDLGTEPEARFTHVLSPELIAAMCQTFIGGGVEAQSAALACLTGLEVSVSLKVRAATSEVTAIKTLSLLFDAVPEAERNANPPSSFELSLQEVDNGRTQQDTLTAGREYAVSAELEREVAELFTPAPSSGDEEPERRRETLNMSWFVTDGKLVELDGEAGFGAGGERTSFVDGHDFDALLDNGWSLPLTADSQASVYMVLRDERGGVGWTERHFDVKGAN